LKKRGRLKGDPSIGKKKRRHTKKQETAEDRNRFSQQENAPTQTRKKPVTIVKNKKTSKRKTPYPPSGRGRKKGSPQRKISGKRPSKSNLKIRIGGADVPDLG